MNRKSIAVLSGILAIGLVSGIILLSESQEQKPEYQIIVTNSNLVNSNTFEFDVLIQGTEEQFELTAYQCALYVWERLKESDTLTFSYIEGTSDLTILPQAAFIVDKSGDLPLIAFASLPGSEIINRDLKKLGRFRITNSKGFKSEPILEWSFKDQLKTIITGKSFRDITVKSQLIVTGE